MITKDNQRCPSKTTSQKKTPANHDVIFDGLLNLGLDYHRMLASRLRKPSYRPQTKFGTR